MEVLRRAVPTHKDRESPCSLGRKRSLRAASHWDRVPEPGSKTVAFHGFAE